ncbi:hypothetical protein PBI_KNOX_11 [Microbacterium phage Knox]|uniref:Minor capsid protein n=15 Tax=Ilzatvirus teagan TaxID=2845595 RepID=A0A2R4A0D4_9CAUD|nr:hypothetical protein PBI_AXIPUP_11 [Microbacterium phage AxiPup]AUX82972.1 hypothetical protein PBI_KNOX_11 [Microbacterium phage Knox]AVJ51208.1 hypothetical protein SEA_PUPPYEGGO_11 [Microbacterium phage PuppyEggo]AVO24402.1 hypothetical protein PBI_ADLER_11 [Microbacterium phage AlexAdler]AVR56428.1 hypothetical protein PBI_RAPTOR_11 [Microbacterium phage Raptor]QCG78213.1 hypothetical protein SEA_GREYS_11 [Microbacterium phage Greys]QDM56685.1 hypothetical protein SEA_VELENE_11 [Microb
MSITMGQLATRYAKASGKPIGSTELRRLAQVGVGIMKKEIQNVHAVDTGTMLNSTTAETAGKDTYLIGPTVNYAVYVARGTSRVAARPFDLTAARLLRSQVADMGFDPDSLGI